MEVQVPPIVRGDFIYDGKFRVDCRRSKYSRASEHMVRAIFEDRRPDRSRHWWEAQTKHYGLQWSNDKKECKSSLQEALAKLSPMGVLMRPPHLVEMESNMRGMYEGRKGLAQHLAACAAYDAKHGFKRRQEEAEEELASEATKCVGHSALKSDVITETAVNRSADVLRREISMMQRKLERLQKMQKWKIEERMRSENMKNRHQRPPSIQLCELPGVRNGSELAPQARWSTLNAYERNEWELMHQPENVFSSSFTFAPKSSKGDTIPTYPQPHASTQNQTSPAKNTDAGQPLDDVFQFQASAAHGSNHNTQPTHQSAIERDGSSKRRSAIDHGTCAERFERFRDAVTSRQRSEQALNQQHIGYQHDHDEEAESASGHTDSPAVKPLSNTGADAQHP